MNNKYGNQLIRFWLNSLLTILVLQLSNSVNATESFSEAAPINVTVTTHLGDGQHFRANDEISLLVNLNRDAYLLLIYQDAGGNLVKLFPVRKNDNGWMQAGNFMSFPRRADGLRLIISAPFGKEHVWAFAATEAFPVIPLHDIDDIKALRNRLQRPGISYSDAHTLLTTHDDER